ncbi:MAG: hypothetical protein ABIH23_28650, partial [bacterium]
MQRGHMGGTGCRFLTAFLAALSVSPVYSADRKEKPVRLNGIEIDVAALSEAKSSSTQSKQPLNPYHALVQFKQPTSPQDRAEIERTGICFLHYIPTNAYIISGPVDSLDILRKDESVVAVVTIPAKAKIDARMRQKTREGEAPAEPKLSKTIKLLFHPETSFDEARKILLSHNAILEATQTGFDFRQTLDSVTLPTHQIESLAEEDSIFLITEVDPPSQPANTNAQDTSNVDEIQPGGIAGYNLDGTGVTVGMWDSGFVRFTHEQVIGRATQEDWNSSGQFNAHSTHVAGIIA